MKTGIALWWWRVTHPGWLTPPENVQEIIANVQREVYESQERRWGPGGSAGHFARLRAQYEAELRALEEHRPLPPDNK